MASNRIPSARRRNPTARELCRAVIHDRANDAWLLAVEPERYTGVVHDTP